MKGVDYMKAFLKRFCDPVVITATGGNILAILAILGIVGDVQVDAITKLIGAVVVALVQLGVLKQPNSTKAS